MTNKPTAVLDCVVDDVDEPLGRRTSCLRERLLDHVRAPHHDLSILLGIECRLERVAGPDRQHLAVAVDDFLIDVRRGPRPRVGRPYVALLVAAQAHHTGSASPDVVRREAEADEGGLDAVVVVAPDDALLVAVHRARTVARGLRLVGPLGRLLDVGDGDAGDRLVSSRLDAIGLERGLEAGRVLRDEILVVPALIDDVGEQPVVKGRVGARLDLEVEHVRLAGRTLGDGDREASSRIDENDAAPLGGFSREPLLLLAERAASQVRHPMCEEVVGLRFVGVGTDGEDDIGDLGVLVGVVELAHAHVAARVALGVVGGPVVDANHLGLERREHELAGAPGVLETAAGATMIEAVEHELVGSVLVQQPLRDAPVDRHGLLPVGVDAIVTGEDARIPQSIRTRAIGGVEDARHLPAPRGGEALD